MGLRKCGNSLSILLLAGGIVLTSSAQTAFAATAEQVQSGTAINNAAGVQTITIAGVDPTTSVLFFETRHNSNRPVGSQLRGRIPTSCANPCTTIEFVRITNESPVSSINVQWYVVTFESGVRVQRGEVTLDTATKNVTIPLALSAVNQAFVTWSKTPAATDTTWDSNDYALAEITSTTNLQFRADAAGSHVAAWQIVEFTDPNDIEVQKGSLAMSTVQTSVTATLSPAVDVNKTFILAGLRQAVSGAANIGSMLLRAQLTNSTTVTIDRSTVGAPAVAITEIVWQAIEFKDETIVSGGTTSFGTGTGQVTVPMEPYLNVSKAVAFGSVQGGAGQNLGRSAYLGDDIVGVASATIALSSDQLTLNRTSTAGAADVAWFVVEFAQGDAQVLSGAYTGNGTDDRVIDDLGFVPDFVMVKGDNTQVAVFRTSTMSGDTSKYAVGSTAPAANLIQSLDSAGDGGFTVGTDARVNTNGTMYYWTAFRAGAGKMQVGSYTGNGSAGRTVTGLGFSPELVFIMSEGADEAVHRSSAPNATGAFNFFDSAAIAGLITSFDADGFTIDGDARVNAAGTVYHYVAWNEAAGYFDVGSYQGDGTTPRSITTVGFDSEQLMLKRHSSGGIMHQRPASLAASTTDASLFFDSFASLCCRIPQLLSNGFQVTNQWNVNGSGGEYSYYAWKRESHPMIVTGSYNGNGGSGAQTIDYIGFDPDVVIVKQLTNATDRTAVIRTSTMADGKLMVGATGLTAQTITSLSVTGHGFTVGTSLEVNQGSTEFHFIALKAGAGTMKVGTYTGQGATPTSITNLGFSPELVFILPEGAQTATFRSSVSNLSFDFNNGGGVAGLVALGSDGFTVSTTDGRVNASGGVYHYVAFNEIPGMMDVGTYVGNGADNRNITGVGFEPEWVIVKEDGNYAVHHTGSVGRSTDASLPFTPLGDGINANNIQALIPDGFQVGDTGFGVVNTSGLTYMYFAWKRPEQSALTAVRLTSFTATRYSQGVLLNWKTGYEIDNLGFHIYREVGGERTRVTRSMVAGSGLMAGQGTAVNAEQRYAAWDLEPASIDPAVVYWLEDLDFNGTSTWSGPITPVAGVVNGAPDLQRSTTLSELGSRSKRRGKVMYSRGARLDVRNWNTRGRATTAPALQMQRALGSQAAMKIGIDQPGWYRVTQPELVAGGFDSNVDPRTIRLFAEGVEHAIKVTGARDGRFDPADYVEFYGSGVDTPYTNTRIYWLTTGGRAGRRITTQPPTSLEQYATGASSFSFTLQQKERSIYFAALRNGDDENWFGAFVSEEPSDLIFEVSNLDPNATSAELEVVLQGVNADATVESDHRVAVLLNGTQVGEIVFDGQAQGSQILTIPAGTLVEGANTVTVVARGGEADFSLVDVVRLRYSHLYRADADVLRFTAAGPGSITVSGFAGSAIRVIDISDPSSPQELRGEVGADSAFSAMTVRLPDQETRTLLAFSESTVSTPAFITRDAPSQWHAATNSADYVAVTHRDFAGSLAPLLERRRLTGLSVAQVDIEDVYDEFSFGEKTPQALRDFVARARGAWQRPPQFLLLVGDATLDPRNYGEMGDADFVPTKQIAMAQVALETASDDWFADADDDGLPELAVGRLPVRTVTQAQSMIAKILEYEDSDGIGWSTDVLLVAGENDGAANFEASTTVLQNLVPSGYTARRVFSGASGVDVARGALLDAVNRGQLIVNYIGHGSVRLWGRESLLSAEDVANDWQNAGRLPLIVAMNCLNGFFHGIYDEESLAETLLRTSGSGAVAAWASSGVTESTTQVRVNQEFFRLLFNNPNLTIGQAAAVAKSAVADRDLRRSWIYFGDPALRLKGLSALVSAETTPTEAAAPSSAQSTPEGEEVSSVQAHAVPAVRLADWNGDGRDDVFLHASNNWRTVFSLPTGDRVRAGQWTAAWDVYPAELNGDRFQDMVLVDRATGSMRQAINDGAGNFQHVDGLLGENWEVHVADLNADRVDDLLLVMPDFGFWSTLLNDGHGHFNHRGGSWAAASSITLGDFSGDGRTDAFLYDASTGAWTIALADGAGDFTYGSGTTMAGLNVQRANVDGDTRADLLVYNPATGAWAEWTSQETGGFSVNGGFWRPELIVRPIEAGRTGRDDVLLYDPRTGEWTFLTTGKADTRQLTGTWRPQPTIATGDLDGDGRTDLLFYDQITGAWLRGLRNRTGSFDFTSGQWSAGWSLASRP